MDDNNGAITMLTTIYTVVGLLYVRFDYVINTAGIRVQKYSVDSKTLTFSPAPGNLQFPNSNQTHLN